MPANVPMPATAQRLMRLLAPSYAVFPTTRSVHAFRTVKNNRELGKQGGCLVMKQTVLGCLLAQLVQLYQT